MPELTPIKRAEFVKRLKQLGWSGPYAGGKHEYMLKDTLRLILPNPHRSDISKGLLAELLKQADISRSEWEAEE